MYEKSAKGHNFGAFIANLVNNTREIKEDLDNCFSLDNASCRKDVNIQRFLSELNIIYDKR